MHCDSAPRALTSAGVHVLVGTLGYLWRESDEKRVMLSYPLEQAEQLSADDTEETEYTALDRGLCSLLSRWKCR